MRTGRRRNPTVTLRRVDRPTGSQRERWYPWLAGAIVGASVLFCAFAVWYGRRRAHDVTHFLFSVQDRGHPGMVGVATALGFYTVALLAAVLAAVTPDRQLRQAWVGAAALFLVVGIDDLLGVHGVVPYGDFIARAVYWVGLFLIVRRLAPSVAGLPGRPFLLAGVALLVTSEIIDSYPPGDDRHYRLYGLCSVLEECTLSVGAWCLAAACVGFAIVRLSPASARAAAAAPLVSPQSG